VYRLGKCTKIKTNIVEDKIYAYNISECAPLVHVIQIFKIN